MSHHAIDILDDSESWADRLTSLQKKLATPPRILSRSAGRPSCSIFKVPSSFVEANSNKYYPQIVSIGPFHRGKPELQMIQEHKYHYLSLLLTRSKLTLTNLFKEILPLESVARDSYSEELALDRNEFIELLVVDGCFIVELFRKVKRLVYFEADDPVLCVSWILYFLMRDLILLENQIPFFILQKLFDVTKGTTEKENCDGSSLVEICFEFLGYGSQERPEEVVESMRGFQATHLLDLYRTSFIPTEFEATKSKEKLPDHVIHCISKLRKAGIKIQPHKDYRNVKGTTFLAVKFRPNGVIEMPTVTIDDFMCYFFANCVAYEISKYKCPRFFTTYTAFLDYLVNSEKDVEYLSDQNVIDNYLGTDAEVADFINNLGRDAPFDSDNCYLQNVIEKVNHYHHSSWNVHIATFKYTYFRTPWSFISAVAALLLLLLSVLQALYGMLSYYNQIASQKRSSS